MNTNGNTISKNKKAYFDFEIIDSFEAGIELKGYEVKSIRAGNVNLKGSYISFLSNEAIAKGIHIGLQNNVAKKTLEPTRDRKIFLHRKTIDYLSGKIKEAGITVIPLEIYKSGNLLKLKVGLVRGRKKYDKKQVLKERTIDKEAKIMMKKYYS